MTLIEQTGDLFTTTAEAIGHGVNVEGAMGAGIAVDFRAKYAGMYPHYLALCKHGELQPGSMMPWAIAEGAHGNLRWVYNIASQDLPGAHANIVWLDSALNRALRHAYRTEQVKTFAIPRIGCGIGGLKWEDVRRVLHSASLRNPRIDLEVWSF